MIYSDDLLAVAKRIFWFGTPQEALEFPNHFLTKRHAQQRGQIGQITIPNTHTLAKLSGGLNQRRGWCIYLYV